MPTPRPAHTPKHHPDPATLGPDDPAGFRDLSPEQFDAKVRRRPIGRTMAYICMDLGIVPGLCAGEFWNKVENVLRRYGGSLNRLYHVHLRREESFQRERDRRPDTWHTDWRDMRRATVREALGCLIGEPVPPADGLMPGLPAIAPS